MDQDATVSSILYNTVSLSLYQQLGRGPPSARVVLKLPLESTVGPRKYLLAEEFEGWKDPPFYACSVEAEAPEGCLLAQVSPLLEIRHLASDSNLRLHPIFYEWITHLPIL